MTQAFLQVAIPVLYVYDEGTVPSEPPGFDMGMLPVVSRVLKDRAGTTKVTVITGSPAPAAALDGAFTHLALQYAKLTKASPEAGNLIAAEFIADNFDAEAVLEHLKRLLEERQRDLAEQVGARGQRRAGTIAPAFEDAGDAADGEDAEDDEEEEDEEADAEDADEDEDDGAGRSGVPR